jgi:hypothetical protein
MASFCTGAFTRKIASPRSSAAGGIAGRQARVAAFATPQAPVIELIDPFFAFIDAPRSGAAIVVSGSRLSLCSPYLRPRCAFDVQRAQQW